MEHATRIFEKNGTTIYWDEAVRVLDALIPDGSVQLIFADPPYNIGKKFANFVDRWPSEIAYAEWCYQWLDLCIRKLARDGSMYVMASTQSMPYIDLHLRERLTVMSRIVWRYDSSGVQAKRSFGSLYEPILFCVKDKCHYTFNAESVLVEAKTGARRRLIDYRKPVPMLYKERKLPGNVWYFPRVRYRMAEYEDHPSQKPEALLELIIRASSNPGDVILDPFAGTFTTNAVAKKIGRASIGIERELEYVKIGLRRLGIQADLDGEPLVPISKTYVRKNGKRSPHRVAREQGELF